MLKVVIVAASVLLVVAASETCDYSEDDSPPESWPQQICESPEVYSECINGGCGPRNCSQIGLPVGCVKIDPKYCIKGCICEEGYLRNSQGICVLKEDCDQCKKHEVYSECINGGCLFRNCSQIGLPVRCVKIDPKYCIKGCICEEGYLRNSQGICVLKKDCDQCKKHEVYSECINGGCLFRNCSQIGLPVRCVKIDPKYCIKGCICEEGYLRNSQGICVLKKDCDQCKKHEVYSECINGGCLFRNCSQIGLPVRCVKIDPKYCIKGCICEEGYLRNSQGICVLKKDCDQICKKNEVFSDCVNGGCSPRTCSQLGFPVPCVKIDPKYCLKGCICDEGYLRNKQGVCVLKKYCPSCGGDRNAIASQCGNNCKDTCANYKKKYVQCPEICRLNGCECKNGYVLDENLKKCVLLKQCTPVCKANEVYSDCTNGGCDAKTCDQLGYPVPCVKIDPAFCKKGCVCTEGYVRDSNGRCILKAECPSCGGDPNAVSSVCGNDCKNTCTNYNKPNIVCPKICKLYSCECRPGYVYDDASKKCILPEQCNSVCNNPHEVYSNCSNGGCDARTCAETGIRLPCVEPDSPDCVKGCKCEDGYLRADDGTCILRADCPACGGDPNAQQGCGINCGRHCSNYMLKKVICPLRPCYINDCECKPDYVYDDNLRRCVLPRDCTPICNANEIYSTCANQKCGPENCSQYGEPRPIRCPPRVTSKCKGGCICAAKYLRNAQGDCIPEDQCPEAKENNSGSTQVDCSAAVHRLTNGNIKFTTNFLYDVVKDNPGNSYIMSPFSVLFPLAQLYLRTDPSESFKQLGTILNLNSKDEVRCAFPEIIRTYQAQNQSTLELATKVFVSDSQTLTENFKKDGREVFSAEGESINFNDAQTAADIINKWVEEKTKNRIKDLVSPAMFSSLTRLVLTNAIYFLGSWVDQFSPDSTTDRDFYVSENVSVQKKTMYRKGSFKYADIASLDAKVLEIPYKGDNLTYVAFLPNSNDGHVQLINKLRDPQVLNDALDQLSFTTVNVYLPRYETTTTIDLSSVLRHLNITGIFSASESNLRDIIESNERLAVSSAIQKAFIKVDEVGTEAAAANAFIVGTTSVMIEETPTFDANHPFVYYIFLQRSPLFAGCLTAN